ncbi:MAG: PilZ domain-containing protein [Lachnospiraceae bacterium]|nr:PilZ domain-containing protein [Lachnospiraceae bacterium]
MFINQVAENSSITMTLRIGGETMTFETVARKRYEKPYKRNMYYIGCDPVEVDGKKVSFGGRLISALIKNEEDGRRYSFPACLASHSRDGAQLLLFSRDNCGPINNREAFRVPCNYHCVIQVGNNKHAIEATVHDISFTGISVVFLSEKYRARNVGESISASIYDNDEHVFKVSGTIVRFIDEYAEGRTLVGARFENPTRAITALVASLQRKETRVRKRIEEKKSGSGNE